MERGSGSRSGILVLELRAGLVGAGAVVGVGVADPWKRGGYSLTSHLWQDND